MENLLESKMMLFSPTDMVGEGELILDLSAGDPVAPICKCRAGKAQGCPGVLWVTPRHSGP